MSLVFAPFFNHVVIDDHSMDTFVGVSPSYRLICVFDLKNWVNRCMPYLSVF